MSPGSKKSAMSSEISSKKSQDDAGSVSHVQCYQRQCDEHVAFDPKELNNEEKRNLHKLYTKMKE